MFGSKPTTAQRVLDQHTSDLLDLALLALSKQVKDLRASIAKLEIDKSKLTEAHEREQREIEHMVGLQRKRGEFEVQAAKREATIQVREENLAAERTQFEKQMSFRTEQFDGQITYLQDIMGQVLSRLPSIDVELGGQARTSKAASKEEK